MAPPTLEKFLCCLELEAGGLILGWIVVIGYGSTFIVLTSFLAFWAELLNVFLPPPGSGGTDTFFGK